MIVMGYPGVGKTTLAKFYHYNDYIDLETSNFYKRPEWYCDYCNVAEDLSRQGFIVLTGCHKEIREILKDSDELTVLIFPEDKLKEKWIERLRKRAEIDGNKEKDLRALERVEDKWEQDHEELEEYINKNIDYCSAIIINEDIFNSKYYIDIINGGIQHLKRMGE